MLQAIDRERILQEENPLWEELEQLLFQQIDDHYTKQARASLHKVDLRWGDTPESLRTADNRQRTIVDVLFEESFKRVKKEIGPRIVELTSTPVEFMQHFSEVYARADAEVKRAMKSGEIDLTGVRNAEEFMQEYDVENDIEITHATFENQQTTSTQTELAYQKAVKEKRYEDASTILDGLRVIAREKELSYQSQILNWGINLAVETGNVAAFLDRLREADALHTPDNGGVDRNYFKPVTSALVNKRYLVGFLTAAARPLTDLQQRELIEMTNGQFHERLLQRFFDLEKVPSESTFEELVKTTAREVCDGISRLHPEPIRINPVYH